MSNELTKVEEYNFDNFVADVDQITNVCKKLMATKHYQNLGEPGIFAILQRAKSMRIDPFDALNGGLYFIKGKVGMSTELQVALIRRAGHSLTKDPKSSDKICIIHGKRADTGDEWTCTYTWDDAVKARLSGNDNFMKYPAVMLYNRCMSLLARQLFPDVIKGCGFTKDELVEITQNKSVEIQPDETLVTAEIASEKTIQIGEAIEVNTVSLEMEKELLDMLNQDEIFKATVVNFVMNTLGKNTLSELSYKDFQKIYNRTKKHLEEKKNDTAESEIGELDQVAQEQDRGE